jgi:hypothetical protein
MTEDNKDTCGTSAETGQNLSKIINRPNYYGAKRAILGEVVTEVNAKGKGLKLSKNWSRSLKIGEIHEIMLTKSVLSPGDELPEFTAIAFFEVTQGSHSVIGDKLFLNESEVGVLVGYEMNHMPNHMNIVFQIISEPPEFLLGDRVKIITIGNE